MLRILLGVLDIFESATWGNIDGVKKAIAAGIDPNAKNIFGSPLLLAAKHGRKNVVNFLLEKTTNINESDINNYTVLSYAAKFGMTEAVEILIKRGAQLETKTLLDGDTALLLAVTNEHKEIVKLLLDNGAKNIPNNNGNTPFKVAVKKGNKEIIDLFLTAKQIPSEELFE